MNFRALVPGGLGGLAVCLLTGCGVFGGTGVLGGAPTIDMTKWRLVSMDVALVGSPSALCPGEPVQLSIVAGLEHRERDKARTVETYQGNRPGLGARGKLGFETFALRSEQGAFDEHGWYTPAPDPFASIDGFTLAVEHSPDPSQAAELNYRPRYDCMREAGLGGVPGMSGQPGAAGGAGERGDYGGSSRAGGGGGSGAVGGMGSAGTAGAGGPTLSAWATVVRTPHHPHLVLLEYASADGVTGRVMFDSHDSFVLRASGGAGGSGGSGGNGGSGGDGGDGDVGGIGGGGGSGGAGGMGGPGGSGGRITLYVDERFPELAELVVLDVSGGPGGSGGAGGAGGSGGSGGRSSAEGAADGAEGSDGSQGAPGSGGARGADGEASVVAADLEQRFAALPDGVQRL